MSSTKVKVCLRRCFIAFLTPPQGWFHISALNIFYFSLFLYQSGKSSLAPFFMLIHVSFYSSLLNVGIHSRIIVPPSWIVKLPKKGSFKSSLRKTPRKKPAGKKKSKEKEMRTFVIKPIPTPNITPVLVFINPKSGGNQGAKLLQKFQWLLNPRQVFDLTQGGPKLGYVKNRHRPYL